MCTWCLDIFLILSDIVVNSQSLRALQSSFISIWSFSLWLLPVDSGFRIVGCLDWEILKDISLHFIMFLFSWFWTLYHSWIFRINVVLLYWFSQTCLFIDFSWTLLIVWLWHLKTQLLLLALTLLERTLCPDFVSWKPNWFNPTQIWKADWYFILYICNLSERMCSADLPDSSVSLAKKTLLLEETCVCF